ncbi:polysaccharide deacetylase family protein [Alteromonas facilis]|uniref:polysaccharide deacetylase family protein n=1 Tax=Alteromonas facilis TaxID=2048004 RepID=UPI0013DD6529|nr:polysaccharide deacetylase family protein [Alteromonas facilis]
MIKATVAQLLNKVPYSIYRTFLGDFVPVLMLHRTRSALSPDGHDLNFLRQCLAHLRKEHYNPISLESLINMANNNLDIPPRSIVFTIDDGFKDNIVDTASVFGEFDIPLTCFVITDFIDKGLWPWDDQVKFALSSSHLQKCTLFLPDTSELMLEQQNSSFLYLKTFLRDKLKRQPQSTIYNWIKDTLYPSLEVDVPVGPPSSFLPASWNDINQFISAGHFVAPHTQSHRILSMLTMEEARREINDSYSLLKEKVTSVSPVFAYPTGRQGDFTERDEQMCAELGLSAAVSTVPGYWSPNCNQYSIPRFSFPTHFEDFLQYIGAIEAIKEKLK